MKRRSSLILLSLVVGFLLCLSLAGLVWAEEEKISLKVGEEVFYGKYSTNYFTADGYTAYCLEPLKDTPEEGKYAPKTLSGNLRKAIYYAYGGAGYDTFVKKHGYLGGTAAFQKANEYCMSHCILSYVYSGSENAFTGLTEAKSEALKKVAAQMKAMPEPPESFYAYTFNSGTDTQVMGASGKDSRGEFSVEKQSNHTEWTKKNSCYSLENAEFALYRQGEEKPAYTVKTDAEGKGRLAEAEKGTYTLRETKSPRGFALSKESKTVKIERNAKTVSVFKEEAQYYPGGLILEKKDALTGKETGQGKGTLEGAQFEVKFYEGWYDNPVEEGKTASKTWIMKTDRQGQIFLAEEYLVSGDPFYRDEKGQPIFPLGTVTFEETKAPEGYELSPELIVRKVTPNGTGPLSVSFQKATVEEQVVRGDLQILKFREPDSQDEVKIPLQGIEFTITSDTTGEAITICTDENGYASTKGMGPGGLPGLAYDTYTVSETKTRDDLMKADDFKISIQSNRETIYYILENKRIVAPVKLIKVDKTTGKIIPFQNTQFDLLDQDKNPVLLKVHYPAEQTTNRFCTDENGSFMLPEQLPKGVYYFAEVKSPAGYCLNREPIRFQVDGNYDWERPIIVVAENEPIQGKLTVEKRDSKSGEPLGDVEFQVTAGEEIVTPDGTIRLRKGEEAGVIRTDASGQGELEGLFPGKYKIREVRQCPGYVLPVNEWEAEAVCDEGMETFEEKLVLENTPTQLQVVKKEEGTNALLSGVEFTLRRFGEEEEIIEEETYVTDEKGEINISGIKPGRYSLSETAPLPGYALFDGEICFEVDETGRIGGQEMARYEVENKKTEILDTSACWKESRRKKIEEGKERVVQDRVSMMNLAEKQEYRLKAVLVELTESGENLIQKEQAVSEKTFVAKGTEEDVFMELQVPEESSGAKKYVVLEYLYLDEQLLSSHEDPKDPGQQVEMEKKPEPTPLTGDDFPTARMTFIVSAHLILTLGFAIFEEKKRRREETERDLEWEELGEQ